MRDLLCVGEYKRREVLLRKRGKCEKDLEVKFLCVRLDGRREEVKGVISVVEM